MIFIKIQQAIMDFDDHFRSGVNDQPYAHDEHGNNCCIMPQKLQCHKMADDRRSPPFVTTNVKIGCILIFCIKIWFAFMNF